MQRFKEFIPIFYTRGLNAPYTEGHIQIARMIMKSLLLFGINSLVLNFKYHVGEPQTEDYFIRESRIQQRIPFFSRDQVFSGNSAILTYSMLMETLTTPRLLLFENALKQRTCVVNIVNCFRYPRIFVKKMSSSPLILHFYFPHLHGRYMMSLFANKADMIIASSQGVAQFLENHGIKREKVAIVYPPIDTEFYKHSSKNLAREKLGLPLQSPIILYMGNLRSARFPEDKVLHLIEELISEIPQTILLIFAPESNLNINRAYEIRKKAEILKLNSSIRIYVKNLSEEFKASVYAASDIFFFPEAGPRTAVEPPLTALEAMASGSVVFAPKLSALSEMITNNENGFLFRQNYADNYVLSNQLIQLLTDEQLRYKICQNARQTILNKASLTTVGREMLRLQRSLLA
jgi:glycosyltransferase involved in cell wall biosynthesis